MNRTVLKAIQGFKDRRLGQADVADLTFFWGEYEAEIGVKAIDYSSVRVEGGEYVTDPLSDTIYVTARARRIRAKLAAIDPAYSRILYMVYGYQNRFAPFGRFGDLAGLAMYTKTAESLGDREAIEKAVANNEKLERAIRMEAEHLLWAASAAYRQASGRTA